MDEVEDERAALEAAMKKLDAMPSELVREAILARPELINLALDALVDVARNSSDASDRKKARQIIHNYGLDLLMLPGTVDAPDE